MVRTQIQLPDEPYRRLRRWATRLGKYRDPGGRSSVAVDHDHHLATSYRG